MHYEIVTGERPVPTPAMVLIGLFPILFSWIFYDEKYSRKAKSLIIAWTVIWCGIAFGAMQLTAPPHAEHAAQSSTAASAPIQSPAPLRDQPSESQNDGREVGPASGVVEREKAMGDHAITPEEFNAMGAKVAEDLKKCGGPCPEDNRSEVDKALDQVFAK